MTTPYKPNVSDRNNELNTLAYNMTEPKPQTPCPDCGRDESNEVSKAGDDWCKFCRRGRIDVHLKPQTPLTDAELKHFIANYDNVAYAEAVDFARSLELKLQEAEAKTSLEGYHALGKQVADALDQRDEAVNALTISRETARQLHEGVINLKAERDQLIKVVDKVMQRAWHQKTCACLQNGRPINPLACDCGYGEVVTLHSLLPHVQAKKGNQDK